MRQLLGRFFIKRSPIVIGLLTASICGVLSTRSVAQSTPESHALTASVASQIDRIVRNHYLGPSIPLASDTEFQRRVYLDLIGRSPTAEETVAFLNAVVSGQPSSMARDALIDDLLERDEFSRYYAKVLEVMLTERRELISVLEFRTMIYEWLVARRPLNELCLEILAADGTGDYLRPAAGFVLNRKADPHLVTRDIGRIFFGRDVQCAQCHDHPLIDDYEQSEYYGILAFVNRTYLFEDPKQGNKPFLGERSEAPLEFASVFFPADAPQPAEPILPLGMALDVEPPPVAPDDAYLVAPDDQRRGVPRYSRRQQLAVLATHRENQSFNRNLANRLWANVMGMGVVHPVDMHHRDNPAVSGELLRALSAHLVNCDYDLREFLRQIAKSETYQRSSQFPALEHWHGPPGGTAELEASIAVLDAAALSLSSEETRLRGELTSAEKQLERSQQAMQRLRRQIADAEEERLAATSQRDAAVARMAELQASQAAEEEISQQQEQLDEANVQLEDQRARVLALQNRSIALSEFVIEARGLQRRAKNQLHDNLDDQSDNHQRKHQSLLLLEWLAIRNNAPLAAPNERLKAGSESALLPNDDVATNTVDRLSALQLELVELWRRGFACHRVRGLSPEQMTGATYTALEMNRSIQTQAEKEWIEKQSENASEGNDLPTREAYVTAAVANHMWDTVEDLIVDRFSSPRGAPQDGFYSTFDQALMVLNDPTYQSWLNPSGGNLVERLAAMESDRALAEQLYMSILSRPATAEESGQVTALLSQFRDDRTTIIKELVWGLLSSTEFRFVM